MTVAELFVNLGVKGADSAGKALGGVKSSLGDIKSMSLEAKAAIIGVVYGLEQMMSNSAQMGTTLTNFNALTGIGAKELQQWQYAARQAGVSGEELTGTMKSMQGAISNQLLGKGGIEGFAMVANKVGLDEKRLRDIPYVMGQLQKFAQTVPQDIGNQMIKSFGVSEGVIAAMRRNAFTPENFAKAPTYSNGEIAQLDKVNVAWSNLGNKIQMAFGHFTSKHGLELVSDITRLTTEVFKLVEAFTKLAEKVKIFSLMGKAVEGWATILQGSTKAVDALGNASNGNPKEKAEAKKQISEFLSGAKDSWRGMQMNSAEEEQAYQKQLQEEFAGKIAPPMKAEPSQKQQNIEINQNLHFQHDGKDHKKTGDSVGKAVKGAMYQYSAQSQVT